MSQNQHILGGLCCFLFNLWSSDKTGWKGGQFPLDITYFQCISESSVPFGFWEVQHITRFNHLQLVLMY